MNSPVGAPNTWPVPSDDTRGSRISPKIVSLVPSDTYNVIALETGADQAARVVARPGHDASRRQIVALPRLDSVPTIVELGTIGGSFAARSGAVASSAGCHHVPVSRSIRFMPEPSPDPRAHAAPMSSEARKELTR
jgi:hypothetical protein